MMVHRSKIRREARKQDINPVDKRTEEVVEEVEEKPKKGRKKAEV